MVPAVVHVVEEHKLKVDPVTDHRHNMVVKPAQDHPHTVEAATQTHVQLMEAGAPGAPMDPAVNPVVEEQKSKVDPVTVHSHNMVVKPAQDPPHQVLAVTQFHVQLMEAGALGAPMDPAVVHVVEEQEQKVDPVTVHSLNMVVKPAQVQPQQASVATQTHVQLMEAGAPGAPMDPAVVHVEEEQEQKVDPVTVHHPNMVVKPVQGQPQQASAATQIHVQLMEAGAPGAPMDPAVPHVVEEENSKLAPVTVHGLNMVVKPAEDQPQQVPAATQTRVHQYLVRECFK